MSFVLTFEGGPRNGERALFDGRSTIIKADGGSYFLVETERYGLPRRYVWCAGHFGPEASPLPPILHADEVLAVTRDIFRGQSL